MEVVAAEVERRHGDDCVCDRCVGFQPGNELAKTHGAYVSADRIAEDERTATRRDWIRASMPVYSEADEITIDLLSIVMGRVERGAAAIARADGLNPDPLAPYLTKDREALRSLRDDLRSWIREAHKLASSLGLDPPSRSRLGIRRLLLDRDVGLPVRGPRPSLGGADADPEPPLAPDRRQLRGVLGRLADPRADVGASARR